MISTSLKKATFLVFLLISCSALAVENFKVPVSNLRVYSQASTLSAVITTLNAGEVVQAGSNPAGGFKKVLVVDGTGKKRIGFIALADIGNPSTPSSSAKPVSSSRSKSGTGLRGHVSFGLVGGIAYDTESSRTIVDQTNRQYTTNPLSGIAPQFGGFILIPYKQNFLINGYLYYKLSSLSGSYVNPYGTSTSFTLTQNFISAGVILEWYMGRSPWWIGPGGQLDYGTSASFVVGSSTTGLSTNQFVGLFAVTGYDFSLSNDIYLTPQIQIGADLNASPMIIEGNVLLNFAYRF